MSEIFGFKQNRVIEFLRCLIVKSLSRVQLFATPWTVAYQAPPSMGFSRQECWSGLPFPSPGELPDPGIESGSPALPADTLLSEPPEKLPYLLLNERNVLGSLSFEIKPVTLNSLASESLSMSSAKLQ